jgi:hypothetical protein
LAAVRDINHRHLHVNEKLVAKSSRIESANDDILNEQPLNCGFGLHGFFNGRLKLVRLYDKVLMISEVPELQQAFLKVK